MLVYLRVYYAAWPDDGMAEVTLNKLLRKLATTEKVVIGLLALGGHSMVEKKLNHLENLIAEIPSHWNGK